MRGWFGGSSTEGALSVEDDDLVVVAESGDEAQASSAALSSPSWRKDDEVVLRHVLILPDDRVAEASDIAALDGYLCRRLGPDPADDSAEVIALSRVQMIDAMHLSQERSRMASLGSRCGGEVVGWQVLQRPSRV